MDMDIDVNSNDIFVSKSEDQRFKHVCQCPAGNSIPSHYFWRAWLYSRTEFFSIKKRLQRQICNEDEDVAC